MADDTVPWLDDREMTAWRALVQTVARLPTALDAQLQRDSRLSFLEYYVLAALTDAPGGAVGMSTLAVLTNAEQSRLSHLVKRLERQGLVRRERSRQRPLHQRRHQRCRTCSHQGGGARARRERPTTRVRSTVGHRCAGPLARLPSD